MQENSVWSFFVMKSRSISGTSKPVHVGVRGDRLSVTGCFVDRHSLISRGDYARGLPGQPIHFMAGRTEGRTLWNRSDHLRLAWRVRPRELTTKSIFFLHPERALASPPLETEKR